MNRSLVLLRSKRPAPAVSAGWLASADPAEWLREIAHCRGQGCEVAIYPVAASPADPRATGVFLLPQEGVPAFRPRVQLLAEALPGVHAPLEAELSAGLLENERGFFFPQRVHLFHPTLGLIGFDAKDELPAAKLLGVPPQREARWNLATPSEKFAPALKNIVIGEPPSPEEMLAEAGHDIGDQSDKLAGKDNAAIDKAKLLGKGLGAGAILGASWIYSAAGKLSDFLSGPGVIGRPGGGKGDNPGPPSRNRLQEWAEKNWQQLLDKRGREIDRLMKLMEQNPDEGLRFALPLTGLGQSRGVAPPGWKLGARNTNFSHGHGGGAIDGWNIETEARLKLEQQYREAAKRETALGRHERAAYIYGNLLGDWGSAAKSLADAGRHRDAVSIYLHKLNNRPAAARCLEEGGLLLQAAAMYAECRHFEKAGDLHAILGNEAAAREMWLTEISAQRDPLEKARILRDKLKDRPTALAILDETWRAGNRPEPSLKAMFAMHREDEDLAAATNLLRDVFEVHVHSLPLMPRLKLGLDESTHWQDGKFTELFEGFAYRRIARELSLRAAGSEDLLDFLPKLAPDDRLLARDARRFSLKASPPKVIHIGPPKGMLKPELVVEISKDALWHSVSPLPKGVSIAGYGKEILAVAQLRDNACHSSALRTTDDPGVSIVDHVVVTSTRGSARLFHFKAHLRLHYRALDRVRTSADDAIGTLRDVMAIARHGEDGEFSILQHTATSSITVHVYSEAAQLRRSLPIDLAPPEARDMPWHLAGRGDQFCFAVGTFFAWHHSDGQFSLTNFQDDVMSLQISPLESVQQALVTNRMEVILLDIPKPGKPVEPTHLYQNPAPQGSSGVPVACYLPDGSIVIAWEGGGQIYAPGNRVTPSATLSFSKDLGDAIAISPRGGGGFAILTRYGRLLVFSR